MHSTQKIHAQRTVRDFFCGFSLAYSYLCLFCVQRIRRYPKRLFTLRYSTMPNTLSFTTTPHADGTIAPPADIARRIAGARAVEVSLSIRETDTRMALRGVSAAEFAAVCAAQRLEADTVEYVLGGEGAISAHTPLHTALHQLLPVS